MKKILQRKNYELAKEVIKRLEGYAQERKWSRVWKKDIPNSHFYILFHKSWLTFGLYLKNKDNKDNIAKAKEILSCKEFDKYNLTQVKDGLQYDKWVFRNFYYPSAIASEEDWVNKALNAFRKLEELVQKSKASAVNSYNDASKN